MSKVDLQSSSLLGARRSDLPDTLVVEGTGGEDREPFAGSGRSPTGLQKLSQVSASSERRHRAELTSSIGK